MPNKRKILCALYDGNIDLLHKIVLLDNLEEVHVILKTPMFTLGKLTVSKIEPCQSTRQEHSWQHCPSSPPAHDSFSDIEFNRASLPQSTWTAHSWVICTLFSSVIITWIDTPCGFWRSNSAVCMNHHLHEQLAWCERCPNLLRWEATIDGDCRLVVCDNSISHRLPGIGWMLAGTCTSAESVALWNWFLIISL